MTRRQLDKIDRKRNSRRKHKNVREEIVVFRGQLGRCLVQSFHVASGRGVEQAEAEGGLRNIL